MKKSILTLAVVSALTVTTFTNEAKADTPSFDFLQLSKTTLDFDDGSEPDGFEFKWNNELTDNVYLNVDYTDVEEGGADLQLTNFGIGYKSDVSNSSVVFAQIDYSKLEASGGFDENGYRASFGVRTAWTENFEVKAAYEYLDIDNFDSESFFVLGGAYNLTDALAFTIDYRKESDLDQTSFGVRYSF